jgi:hypothetical protein
MACAVSIGRKENNAVGFRGIRREREREREKATERDPATFATVPTRGTFLTELFATKDGRNL